MARITVTEVPLNFTEIRNKLVKIVSAMGLLCGVLTYLFYHFVPIKSMNFKSDGEKLTYVLQCNLPSILFIIVLVQVIATLRRTSYQVNPLSTKDLHKVQVPIRVLQNTLEQFVINIFLQLISATWFGNDHMKLIPACAFWFLVGRVLFWIGYNDPTENRIRRAFGFVLTVLPSVALACFCSFMSLRDVYQTYF